MNIRKILVRIGCGGCLLVVSVFFFAFGVLGYRRIIDDEKTALACTEHICRELELPSQSLLFLGGLVAREPQYVFEITLDDFPMEKFRPYNSSNPEYTYQKIVHTAGYLCKNPPPFDNEFDLREFHYGSKNYVFFNGKTKKYLFVYGY